MKAEPESGWSLALSVPAAAAPLFQAALDTLGGALFTGGPDEKKGTVPFKAYLAERPDEVAVTALLGAAAAAARTAVPAYEVEALPDLDWVAESQRALPPVRAGRFYVHGSHVTAPPPAASIPIRIDANAAFGTGRHESTRGCLVALSRLAKAGAFRRPLDMGCGSGILAIAMAKLWPVEVVAADNDRLALEVARLNARINGVAARLRIVKSDGYRGAVLVRHAPYDLIVANILAEPLAAMARDLARYLGPDGVAVLAGLLSDQEGAVLTPHRVEGLRLEQRIVLGDWTTLVLAR